jgi:hypothetical protein
MTDHTEEDSDNPIWCAAWRLIRQHGDAALEVVDREIAEALHAGDHAKVSEWRAISLAIEDLSR